VRGDVPGSDFRVRVHRFEGRDGSAPRAYLQAALHGNELPGVAALHVLLPMIAAVEADGRLAGSVTIVPYANPIGLGQHLFGAHSGRFALGSRINFNRDFPLIDDPDPRLLADDGKPAFAEDRLKSRLLGMSLEHDIVLDLHCDDEAPAYLYVQKPLWPALSDLAAALGVEAVILWDISSDGAFDEAALRPWLKTLDAAKLARRVVSTVELRGVSDVSPDIARVDAEGLYRFLVARGVVLDDAAPPPGEWTGPAVPTENVEMIAAPAGGGILYHVRPGERVAAADRLAEILADPGVPGGAVVVSAPQGGLVLTCRSHRFTRAGDDLLKLLGDGPAATPRTGALEA
jgi:uncharacterized protein